MRMDTNMGFWIMPWFFYVFSVIFFGFLVVTIINSVRQWHKNNNSPVLTVDVKVIGKRTNIRRTGTMQNHTNHTSYYVTFQLTHGDRMELCISGTEYGLLAEGDIGMLTFQGTRFLKFQRV